MNGRFLVAPNDGPVEINIFADKSALILDWLLREGIKRQEFSLREVAKEINVSLGLVQRVFSNLVLKGLLQTVGIRTSKKYSFKKAHRLLESWLDHYNIVKKCKMRTYSSSFSDRREFFQVLQNSNINKKVALALHSAAEAHGHANTNLKTFELYMLDTTVRANLEDILELEPQERGYTVLLIEPYYESLLNLSEDSYKNIKVSPALLNFLDLYHFPLRGQEQAEFLAEHIPELKQIFRKGKSL